MRFLRRSLVGLFLFSLTFGLLVIGVSNIFYAFVDQFSDESFAREEEERIFAANVLTITPDTIAPILHSFGQVRSRRTLDIRAPVSGRVIELADNFLEGGLVNKGQLLAKIDPADAQTAVDVARTDLLEAEADSFEAQSALEIAQDDLISAQEQLTLQERAFQRQNDLKNRGVGSDAAVEGAELTLASSKQAVLRGRQTVEQAKAKLNQVAILIERRKINLRNAERLLAATEVFAAFEGRLFEVAVTKGGLVSGNEALAKLIDPSALEVSFTVSTKQYGRLLDSEGMLLELPVGVKLEVLGTDLAFPAKLTRESAAVKEGTTGRLLYAELLNARGLRPGDFVTVGIREPELHDIARIPATAVDADNTVLIVNAENRLETAQVDVVRRQGDDLLIHASKLAGQEIVAERSPVLGQGIKIRPVRREGETPDAEKLIKLDDARRAKLIAFVKASADISEDLKSQMLMHLKKTEVPEEMVINLEARMGS